MLNKYSGFTLIEMLVVISIIGLLATLSLTSFTAAQKQAKDTQRKNDIKQYQTGLVSFASRNTGFYPNETSAVQAKADLCTDLGLSNCPDDPKTTAHYIYCSDHDSLGDGAGQSTAYALWATLDGTPSTSYWVVCNNGKVGTSASIPTCGASFNCPLP